MNLLKIWSSCGVSFASAGGGSGSAAEAAPAKSAPPANNAPPHNNANNPALQIIGTPVAPCLNSRTRKDDRHGRACEEPPQGPAKGDTLQKLQIINAPALEALVSMADAIAIVDAAMRDLSSGRVVSPQRTVMSVNPATRL